MSTMKRTLRYRYAQAILALVAVVFMTGCTGNYGRLKTSQEWTDAFRKQLELPDYNYYYCGRENLPYAVVGIDPRYTFEDRLWHKIESKEDVYRRAAGVLVWNDQWSRGADIVDPDGNRIGIWFSYYRNTTVKMGPGNTVAVFNPYQASPWANYMDNDQLP